MLRIDQSLTSEAARLYQREDERAKRGDAILKLARGAKLEGLEWSHATWWMPQERAQCETQQILEPHGYLVDGSDNWSSSSRGCGPQLKLDIVGNFNLVNHTFYSIQCKLVPDLGIGGAPVEWQAPRRLFQLRKGLHERVKEHLGNSYAELFGSVHFADRMQSVAGKMDRLRDWLVTLAELVNARKVPPFIAVLLLEFLQVPTQKLSFSL